MSKYRKFSLCFEDMLNNILMQRKNGNTVRYKREKVLFNDWKIEEIPLKAGTGIFPCYKRGHKCAGVRKVKIQIDLKLSRNRTKLRLIEGLAKTKCFSTILIINVKNTGHKRRKVI